MKSYCLPNIPHHCLCRDLGHTAALVLVQQQPTSSWAKSTNALANRLLPGCPAPRGQATFLAQQTQQKRQEKPLLTGYIWPQELPQLHLKTCQGWCGAPLCAPYNSPSAPQPSLFCPSKAMYTKGPVTKQQGSKGCFFPLKEKGGVVVKTHLILKSQMCQKHTW